MTFVIPCDSNPSPTTKPDKGATASSYAPHNGSSGKNDSTYWAKGTGFGFGSTVSSWDIEKAMKQKKREEKDMVVILQVLRGFLQTFSEEARPEHSSKDEELEESSLVSTQEVDQLMSAFAELMVAYSAPDILSSYLHNDSVLDMSRHIPLYRAVLSLLRPLAENTHTLCFLMQKKNGAPSIVSLLSKLNSCVDTYNSRLNLTTKFDVPLKADTKRTSNSGSLKSRLKLASYGGLNEPNSTSSVEDKSELESEELSELMEEIKETTNFVLHRVRQHELTMMASPETHPNADSNEVDEQNKKENEKMNWNSEKFYVGRMAELQFDAFELITEKEDGTLQFNVPYHYASVVRDVRSKDADMFNINRARRLAQEVASLSTSLPLSFSSTVFLRCDEQRLDIMKVLITGPEGTPYENGCFEFDIYIPPEYPKSPMSVNLQTTGKHTVRFNPNLYNDGKVCLSILNTWHGRPEEKWNEKTSNLLQVLVSIQSLILVAEPYFNEPGYERWKGTPQGEQNNSDYNTNIRQACVKWAILEQIKKPSACFKEIIHQHFMLKKDKVFSQCETWLNETKELSSKRKSLKHHYEALKSYHKELQIEMAKLGDQSAAETASPIVTSQLLNEATSDDVTDSAIASSSTQ